MPPSPQDLLFCLSISPNAVLPAPLTAGPSAHTLSRPPPPVGLAPHSPHHMNVCLETTFFFQFLSHPQRSTPADHILLMHKQRPGTGFASPFLPPVPGSGDGVLGGEGLLHREPGAGCPSWRHPPSPLPGGAGQEALHVGLAFPGQPLWARNLALSVLSLGKASRPQQVLAGPCLATYPVQGAEDSSSQPD